MDTSLNYIQRYWRHILIGLFVIVLAYALLFRGLNTLTGARYAAPELQSQSDSLSLVAIYHNPINAPYKLLVWLGLTLGHHSVLVCRVAAAVCAIPIAILYYWLTLHWYSKRVALLSSILFVSSSGFLHIGRYGTGLILQMATLVLTSSVVLYRRTVHERLVAYLLVCIVACCFFIPGMVWFLLIELFLLRKRIRHMLHRIGPIHSVLLLTAGLLLIGPLVVACTHNPSTIEAILGLPRAVPTPHQFIKNLLQVLSSIVYHGYWPETYWLYGAPLLNIGEILLFIAGLFELVKRPILRGNYFTLSALVIGTLLVALGSTATIALLIPLIYLVIAGGIYYLLDQWLHVFPYNPVARAVGISLICMITLFSAWYHLQAYYTAWPNAPQTKHIYSISQPL